MCQIKAFEWPTKWSMIHNSSVKCLFLDWYFLLNNSSYIILMLLPLKLVLHSPIATCNSLQLVNSHIPANSIIQMTFHCVKCLARGHPAGELKPPLKLWISVYPHHRVALPWKVLKDFFGTFLKTHKHSWWSLCLFLPRLTLTVIFTFYKCA